MPCISGFVDDVCVAIVLHCSRRVQNPDPPPPPFSPVRFVSLLPVLLSLNLAAADDPPATTCSASPHHRITGRATGHGPMATPRTLGFVSLTAFSLYSCAVVILGTS